MWSASDRCPGCRGDRINGSGSGTFEDMKVQHTKPSHPRYISGIRENLFASRFGLSEISGSLGDMGTFIPLTAALIAVNGLGAGSVLFFAGLFNITTGLLFGIPMCVQPMKAIAAVAITEKLTPAEIHGAGIFVGGFFLLISLPGFLRIIRKVMPLCVVRGLQLGIGLSLMIKGFSYIAETGAFLGADSILTGIAGAVIVFLFFFSKRFPSALVLFALGVVITYASVPGARNVPLYGSDFPSFSIPEPRLIIEGTLKAGFAQIPLTLLNSIIAVCALSGKLFPEKPAAAKTVGVSIGIMNIVGGFFGAMPMCHGAGGLSGQYRFGARTAGSMLMLGGAKMLLGILAASAVTAVMLHYPRSILGVLLIVSGLELGILIRDQKERTLMFISLSTAAAILALGTLAGFSAGLFCAFAVHKGLFKIEKSFDPERIINVYNEDSRAGDKNGG